MTIIYRAKDGKEFTNEKDCYEYERSMLLEGVLMWNRKGERTDRTESALWVYLFSNTPDTAKNFMLACQSEGTGHEGIAEEDTGLFYWDDWDNTYRYLDKEQRDALRNILQEI
jgi:hypothetical protein